MSICRGLVLSAVVAVAATPSLASRRPEVSNGGLLQTTVGGKAVVLPLAHTDVQAEIAGVVASVIVTQQFHNPYATPIEAVYVFPLPHEAAVHGMTITIGKRTIRGVVKRREQARAIYNRARAQGRTAALLDQERPNIFTQAVANIMPKEKILVRIQYTEALPSTDGLYEFAFPMVVGPRYVSGGEPLPTRTGHGWGRDTTRVPDASRITPHLLARGLRPGHDVALRLSIDGGRTVRDLSVVAHRATTQRSGSVALVTLDPRDSIPNKDFVVRYRLAGAMPEASLLTQRPRGKRPGHFLLMVHPKARMQPADIAPREYVFVVDNSGSMEGFPLQQAQAVVSRLLSSVRARDTFQIIKFSGTPDQLAPRPLPATPKNVRTGVSYVQQMTGGGGTEFLPALKICLEAPKDPGRARIVLFITDGYIGDEAEVLRFVRRHRGEANLFALGVGSSVNRFLIDGMARLGGGDPFTMLNTEQADAVVRRIHATLSRPALTSIRVDWGGLEVKDLSPARPPDLFAERPVVLAGRYRRGGAAMIVVRGRLAGRAFEQRLAVSLPAAEPDTASTDTRAPAIAHLWARRRLGELADLEAVEPTRHGEVERQTTQIALDYNLMSRYTSFVAVDTRVRSPTGKPLVVPVPAAAPDGVGNLAAPPRAVVGHAATAVNGPDRDGDGIPDAHDRCPDEPETYNGFEDDDGCPDRGRVVIHRGRIEILDKVYFSSWTAKIKPISFPILDAIAATLKGNPQILQIELQGHGDDREPPRLALRRALAVQRYLIARGVDPARLVVKSYGKTRPVQRGHNKTAWSHNRRVEFVILRRMK
jgi:Ca-activated chloride channel homolog